MLLNFPRVDRRYAIAAALALPVVFLGPYVIPFMLACAFFAAAFAVFATFAARAGYRTWQIALVPLAMVPFVGIFGSADELPNWMQLVAHLFPPTYILQGIRTLVEFGAFDGAAFVASVLLTAVYLFFVYLWAAAPAPGAYGRLQAND